MSKLIFRSRLLCYGVAFFMASFTGCSCETEKASMANPDAVHQTYTVSYDGASNKSNVTVRFRFGGAGGTNLELDGVARVKHSTYPLSVSRLLGAHYTGGGDGHVADHAFEYTDTAGKTYKNSIRLASVDFPADMPAEISVSKALVVTFVGDPVAQGERVELTINQKIQDQMVSKTVGSNDLVGAKVVAVEVGDRQQFAEGDATMHLTRRHSGQLQEGTSRGGSMTATYTTAPRKVVFVK